MNVAWKEERNYKKIVQNTQGMWQGRQGTKARNVTRNVARKGARYGTYSKKRSKVRYL